MHSVLEEVKAYRKIIEDAEPIRNESLQMSVNLLKEAQDKLLDCFNNNPGNYSELKQLLQVANTYALHVEVFMSYYDIEYKKTKDRRRDAEILYRDISAYLDDVLKEEKDNNKYLVLFSYKEAAHQYFLNSLDFLFEVEVQLQKRVDTAKTYMEEVKNEYISKYTDNIVVGG